MNIAVTYYPPIYYARLAGARGRYLFIVPAIVGLPVYFARVLSPFYLDFPPDDFPYLAIALVSDNIYGMAQVLIILIMCRILTSRRINRIINYQNFSIDLTEKRNVNRLTALGILFLIIAIGSLVTLAVVSGYGVENWILNPRAGYQEYRRGNGQYWVLAQILLSFSTFLLLHTSQSKFKFVYYLLLNGIVWWFLGSKAFLIGLGAFALSMWFYKFGKSYLIFLIFFLSTFSLMIANYFFVKDSAVDFDTLKSVLEYFDMYQIGIMYYKEYYGNRIDLFFGNIFLSNFWTYIPRALYEDKPWVYGITTIVEHFFPGAPEAGNTPGFGGSVEQFADFGYFGLLFAPFFDLTYLLRTAATIVICRVLLDGSWKTGKLFLLSVFFLSPNWTPWAGGLYLLSLIVFLGFVFFCFNLLGRNRWKLRREVAPVV